MKDSTENKYMEFYSTSKNRYLLRHVDNNYVVVDTGSLARMDKDYSISITGKILKVQSDSVVLWQKGCYPIVASANKISDDIPMMANTILDAKALDYSCKVHRKPFNGYAISDDQNDTINDFIAGYKSNNGKYSESEVEQIFTYIKQYFEDIKNLKKSDTLIMLLKEILSGSQGKLDDNVWVDMVHVTDAPEGVNLVNIYNLRKQ